MERYIPAIQESFRRSGFPIERAEKVQQIMIGRSENSAVETVQRQQWDYRDKDETSSIIVMEDSVVVQTTAYTRFEEFAAVLHMAFDTVCKASEQDELGRVHRIGLRYIDVIRESGGKNYRYYLRPGFHGLSDAACLSEQHLQRMESLGGTDLGGLPGFMVVRISQNNQGLVLPPDLTERAPRLPSSLKLGQPATLIDMDHFLEGNFSCDTDWVVDNTYRIA